MGCRAHPRQRSRQRRLAMVNVTNRTHIYVGLISLKFFLRHSTTPLESKKRAQLLLIMPSAMLLGTTAYLSNSMVKVALPWVADRKSVA